MNSDRHSSILRLPSFRLHTLKIYEGADPGLKGARGGCCGHFLKKAGPLWDLPRKENPLLFVSCQVRWNVIGEVMSIVGGSPRRSVGRSVLLHVDKTAVELVV